MRLHLQKFNQKGFSWHFVLPVLAIVGVAAIGTYLLTASHAATAGCESFDLDFKAQTMTIPASSTPTKDVKTTNANFGACMAYVERMVNIAYGTNFDGFAVYADGFKDTAPATATVKGYIGVANSSAYSATVDGKFSANLLNRVHAFQNFFAYGTTDVTIDGLMAPVKSGTAWNPSTGMLSMCGIAEHVAAGTSSFASDASGNSSHYGCAAGIGTPTWRSNIKGIAKPPVGSLALACATDGTGGAKFSFSDPNGATTAQLTITYASGASPATATTSYTAPSSALVTTTASVPAAKVAGAWSAKLVVADLWGTQTKTVAASHATCQPATSQSSGGGGTTGGSGGTSGGCVDISDPSCFSGYQDPCTTDPSSCASDPNQYDTICDASCDASSDGSDFSFDGSDSTGSGGNGTGCTDTCDGSNDTANASNDGSSSSNGSGGRRTGSTSAGTAKKSGGNAIARFFHGVRSALDKLF